MVDRVRPAARLPGLVLAGLCLAVTQPPAANAVEILTSSSEVI